MAQTNHEEIAALEAAAQRIETPCGDGSMVWRRWGTGSPLVLIHGGQGAWTHWVRNIAALARTHAVLVPDLPGYGDSDELPVHDFDHLVAVVVAGLDQVLPPGDAFDLVGFSFGGVVAGLVAAAMGERVRNLILIGSGGFGPSQRKEQYVNWRKTEGAEALRAAHYHNLRVQMISDTAKIDELALLIQTENTRRARTKSRVLVRPSDMMLEVLPRVAARVHGIWGARDVTAGEELANRGALLKRVKPGAEFSIIPNAGHWAAYESPELVDEKILEIASGRTAGV